MKIALSGSSGSGKTTLVAYIKEKYGLTHISGSAGDLKTEGDKMMLDQEFGYPGGGHVGVIKYSALNPEYGLLNQQKLQERRAELIMNNDDFVTDRSPVDNLTYFINQVAYHPMVTDQVVEEFAEKCVEVFEQLDLVIYVKAVQPREVERNGSRVANTWYQKQVDALFSFWLEFFSARSTGTTQIEVISVWDWDKRRKRISHILETMHKMKPVKGWDEHSWDTPKKVE